MDSNSLPMVPDLEVLPDALRRLVLALLVLGPLVFLVLVLVGIGSSPTVVVEATVVGSASSEDETYAMSEIPEESLTRVVVEEALREGRASVEATTEEVRSDEGIPSREFYVRHDGRVVRVTVGS